MQTKYLFISGGVISGLGKGITTASIALLLKSAGFKVAPIKADPYLNVDAGTMNPVVHGETFVTDDGMETDQDLGHYERFISEDLTRLNYMTSGQVYLSVIERERKLGYDGVCVETVPHIPEEIIRRLKKLAKESVADFVLCEIGGTSGEYQNAMFLEAARLLKLKKAGNVLNIHVAYLPTPPSLGELKSKPVQTSVHLLNEAGVQPDIIIGRAEKNLDKERVKKIATFCNVSDRDVFSNPDVSSVYFVPQILAKQKLCERILKKFGLKSRKKDLKKWQDFVSKIKQTKREVQIAIVGKYFRSGDFSLEDSYVCVMEAVKHGCWWNAVQPEISWLDSVDIEKRGTSLLEKYQGIIGPQGWGNRGVEGKIMAAGFAREKKIPYLGLCFGMQLAVVEFARNVCHLKKAHTTEVDAKTPHPVIHIMPDQKEYLAKHQYGGTMRLGAWPCKVREKTKLWKAYQKSSRFKVPASVRLRLTSAGRQGSRLIIKERHRHRYEFNNKYRKLFEKNGLVISGTTPDNKLVEAIEFTNHPFFLGTQFHPEFKSRPLSPHPLFLEFIKACLVNEK